MNPCCIFSSSVGSEDFGGSSGAVCGQGIYIGMRVSGGEATSGHHLDARLLSSQDTQRTGQSR